MKKKFFYFIEKFMRLNVDMISEIFEKNQELGSKK